MLKLLNSALETCPIQASATAGVTPSVTRALVTSPALQEIVTHAQWPAFAKFHTANPHVFETARSMALGRKRAGYSKGGIKAILEIMRWDYEMQVGPNGEPWKLNNNWAPILSRLLECERQLRSEVF